MQSLSSLVFLSICLAFISAASVPPETWKVCKNNDPKLNDCLKLTVQSIIKELKKGNSKLGLPSIDPLRIEELAIHNTNGQSVGLDLIFRKLKIYGVSNGVIDKVKADLNKGEVIIDFHIPGELKIDSEYLAKGKVLVFPINGAGDSTLVFEQFAGQIILRLKQVNKGGVDYREASKSEMKFDTSKLHLNFKSSTSADAAYIKNLNAILNQNSKEILEDVKPGINKAFIVAIEDFANRVFGKVPYNKLLLP